MASCFTALWSIYQNNKYSYKKYTTKIKTSLKMSTTRCCAPLWLRYSILILWLAIFGLLIFIAAKFVFCLERNGKVSNTKRCNANKNGGDPLEHNRTSQNKYSPGPRIRVRLQKRPIGCSKWKCLALKVVSKLCGKNSSPKQFQQIIAEKPTTKLHNYRNHKRRFCICN